MYNYGMCLPPTKHPQYLTPVLNCIEGIVHTEMIILSSFIHPHLIQNLYDFFLSLIFCFVLNTADFPMYGLKQLKHP